MSTAASILNTPARVGDALVRSATHVKLDKLSGHFMTLSKFITKPTWARNILSGTVIGHPMHPMLTDIPIGAWVACGVMDVVGGPGADHASRTLIATGMVAAVPTALAGLNDWSDTYGADTNIGVAHATGVHVALALYGGSLVSRLRGRTGLGKALAFAGLGALIASAYLGGHLSFGRAMVVNHTAFEERPTAWTDVAASDDLADGAAVRVNAGDAAVLLRRENGRIYALANTCSHMGGPLDEGAFADGCVTCPWHGSVFQLADGDIVRGPATVRQPRYDVRETDGRIEVRARD